MKSRIVVVCTDQGLHGQIDLDRFDVVDGEVRYVKIREGRPPARGDGVALDDGVEIPISIGTRMAMAVTSAQAENGTWRWRCPQCGRDRPLKDANLRAALINLAEAGVSRLDLSALPR